MKKSPQRVINKIQETMNQGIRTILVEGPADIALYRGFYGNSKFRHMGSCDNVIEVQRYCNKALGKTPLVVSIIDRDDRTEEDIVDLATENIFVLRENEIESVFLRPDIIEVLFGDEVFQRYVQDICANARNRTQAVDISYEEALRILKKEVSSKYNIRILLRTANIENMGNKKNIEFLCSLLQEKGVIDMLADILPEIPETESKTRSKMDFQKELQDFMPTPISTYPNLDNNLKKQDEQR